MITQGYNDKYKTDFSEKEMLEFLQTQYSREIISEILGISHPTVNKQYKKNAIKPIRTHGRSL